MTPEKNSRTGSAWRGVKLPAFSTAPSPGTFDVLVIGGGITGLTAAQLLAAAGKRVAVLEARTIGSGETGNTTAHLTELVDYRYQRIASSFGESGAQAVAASSRAAIEHIAANARSIECDFERAPGFLYADATDPEQATGKHEEELERELEAAKRAGLQISLTQETTLPFAVTSALRVENQAQFHALKYLGGIAARFVAQGGTIYEQTRVQSVKDGTPCVVTTDAGVELRAEQVLVCANVPVNDVFLMQTKLIAYRTYAIAAEVQRAPAPGLFFDLAEPYHYVRSHVIDGKKVLIIGGADHKTGLSHSPTTDHFAELTDFAQPRFGVTNVAYRWSGQVIEPADGLPYIGKNPLDSNVYVATGFAGNGITFGVVAAMIMSDLALGKTNEWSKLYDATRTHLTRALGNIMSAGMEFGVHRVDGWLRTARVQLDELARGDGKVVAVGLHRLAVYRDDSGSLHALEPTCTHMGCQVNWNGAEKSWDCPCHGGRFDVDGKVLNGPPIHELTRVDLTNQK